MQGMNIPPVFNFCEMCTEFNESNKQYFSNYKYPATFPGNGYTSAIPLDSSLQLAVAFAQYSIYKNPTALPRTCPDAGAPPPLARGAADTGSDRKYPSRPLAGRGQGDEVSAFDDAGDEIAQLTSAIRGAFDRAGEPAGAIEHRGLQRV